MRELFNILEEVYVFYTSSTKLISSLNESIARLEVNNPLKLTNSSETRWDARTESIKSVWGSYMAIKDSLGELATAADAKT